MIDTVLSGAVAPGTVSTFHAGEVQAVPGQSPHYVGLFEALRLGRALKLDVPDDVTIIAVEPADCLTVGGEMHDSVIAAVDEVLRIIEDLAVQICLADSENLRSA